MVSDGAALDLQAIGARAEAATGGTWVVANSEMLGIVEQDLDPNGLGLVYGRDVVQAIGYEDDEQAQADAAFIAAARSDVPALVAEVERLTQENSRLRELADHNMDEALRRTVAERDVIEKAKAWRAEHSYFDESLDSVRALAAAVDALTQPEEEAP